MKALSLFHWLKTIDSVLEFIYREMDSDMRKPIEDDLITMHTEIEELLESALEKVEL